MRKVYVGFRLVFVCLCVTFVLVSLLADRTCEVLSVRAGFVIASTNARQIDQMIAEMNYAVRTCANVTI